MKTYIIGEIGPNHNGSIEIALDMIEKIAQTGVDAIKFQLSVPENAYSKDAFKPKYQLENDKSTKAPLEMSKKNQLTFEDHKTLYNACIKHKVDYLCTAFEMESLKFLDSNFDLKYFKIASGEIFTLDTLDYISQRKKPIILSTGMSTYDDIEFCINYLNRHDKKDITILHCISNYPAQDNEMNLRMLYSLKDRFGLKVGLSDHSLGITAPICAVAMGATMIEKHITLDKNMNGPDHKASINVKECEEMVNHIRRCEVMLGSGVREFSAEEIEIRKAARKSIVAVKDLPLGHTLSYKDVCFKRPGTGISPKELDSFLGKKLAVAVESDRVLKKEFFDEKD